VRVTRNYQIVISSLLQQLNSDAERFGSVPTGAGGIDWLNVSLVNAVISEIGWALRDRFLRERDAARERGEKKAIVFLEGVEMPFVIHNKAVGEGHSKQPLLVHWDGLAIRFGKVRESYPSTGGNAGTIGVIECPGLTCLRLGESGIAAENAGAVRRPGNHNQGMSCHSPRCLCRSA